MIHDNSIKSYVWIIIYESWFASTFMVYEILIQSWLMVFDDKYYECELLIQAIYVNTMIQCGPPQLQDGL